MQKNPAEIERFQPDLAGVSGFEPEASWSRTKRDTKLRHTPKCFSIILYRSDKIKWYFNFLLNVFDFSANRRKIEF